MRLQNFELSSSVKFAPDFSLVDQIYSNNISDISGTLPNRVGKLVAQTPTAAAWPSSRLEVQWRGTEEKLS
jgi:hypothetical protein